MEFWADFFAVNKVFNLLDILPYALSSSRWRILILDEANGGVTSPSYH
jgi:hypothetical protein